MIITAALNAVALHSPSLAGDDYYYAGGKRHRLERMPGLRSVPVPGGYPVSSSRSRQAPEIRELWEKHGLVIVRESDYRSAVREGVPGGNPVFDYGREAPLVVTDEFIACFPPGMTENDIAEINDRYGVAILRKFPHPPNTFLLRALGGEELAALRLANVYHEREGAVFSHPNFISRKSKRFLPDDPYFPRQWHLNSTGQDGAMQKQDVDAPGAWDVTTGSRDVIIAVIDDGVDLSHEDLQGGKFVAGHDFYDGDNDPSAEPGNEDYHGTSVIGVVAANGDNGIGVSGIAPGCRVMPIRLVAGPTSDEQDAAAIRWAADNGAWIISNSWGPPDGNPYFNGDEQNYPLPDIMRAAIDHAADNGRGGRGCVILWASGNGNEPVGLDGYASYEKVAAVGACNDRGIRSFYSDYGPELDVCAPSDGGGTAGIWTTDLTGHDGYNPGSPLFGDGEGNYTNGFGGTSSACPLAAGVVALILSREPDLTRAEVMRRLKDTADRTDFGSGSYGIDGRSIFYGFGRVNARSSLTGRTRHPAVELSLSPASARRGDPVKISYSMRGGSEGVLNDGDAYVAVIDSLDRVFFMDPFHSVTEVRKSISPGIAAGDADGMIGPGFVLNGDVPGVIRVYGGIVTRGQDPLNPANWIHTPSLAILDYLP